MALWHSRDIRGISRRGYELSPNFQSFHLIISFFFFLLHDGVKADLCNRPGFLAFGAPVNKSLNTLCSA
jgi:hypothetical protein